MGSNRRRRRVEPADGWEQIELLCAWPEQRDYELIRPLVLFGSPASERAKETGAASERTLQRRVSRSDAEGMESLFGSEAARRKKLPPSVRRLVVDLKAEYPGFCPNSLNKIAEPSRTTITFTQSYATGPTARCTVRVRARIGANVPGDSEDPPGRATRIEVSPRRARSDP